MIGQIIFNWCAEHKGETVAGMKLCKRYYVPERGLRKYRCEHVHDGRYDDVL